MPGPMLPMPPGANARNAWGEGVTAEEISLRGQPLPLCSIYPIYFQYNTHTM